MTLCVSEAPMLNYAPVPETYFETPAVSEQRLSRAIDRHRAGPLALVLARRGLGPYRGYAEMLLAMRELIDRGARLDVIGESVDGEPLFALVIGSSESKRTSVLISGLHPMEWIGIETHLYLLDRLVERPPTDRRIVSIAIANPDGVRQVEHNLRIGRRRLVRHNRRRVDLNRNFPSYWGRFTLAQLLPKRFFSPGSAPASEPEVRAITSYFKGSMVDRAVSFHSFGGLILYPVRSDVPPAARCRGAPALGSTHRPARRRALPVSRRAIVALRTGCHRSGHGARLLPRSTRRHQPLDRMLPRRPVPARAAEVARAVRLVQSAAPGRLGAPHRRGGRALRARNGAPRRLTAPPRNAGVVEPPIADYVSPPFVPIV